MYRRPLRTSTAAAVAALLLSGAVALTACAPADDDASATGSATATTEPSASATTGEPDATTTPTTDPDVGEPIDMTCDQLVTPEQMYEYSPNVSLLDDYTPEAGSKAEQAVSYKGVACQWVQNSSGSAINISVAKLDEATINALANVAVEESNSVPTYGAEGYFGVFDGNGQAEVFDGSYWIVARSAEFLEPGDVEQLMGFIQQNLAG